MRVFVKRIKTKNAGWLMKKQAGKFAAIMLAIMTAMVLTPGLTAAGVRVSPLGDPWLVPDAYEDSFVNPARLALLDKNMFVGGTWNSFDKENGPGLYNFTSWSENPSISYEGKFGPVNAGLIYRGFYEGRWGIYPEQTAGLFDNDVSVMAAMKFDKSLSAGLIAVFTAGKNIIPQMEEIYGTSIVAGVNYAMDNMDLGAVITGSNSFTGLANYNAGLNLLLEIRADAGSVIRALCDTTYGSAKTNPTLDSVPNPFGNEFLGTYGGNNITAISYTRTIDKTNYIISLSNAWMPFNIKSRGSAASYYQNIYEVTSRTETLKVKAGLETRFLADWLTVRASCEPFSYDYTDMYQRHNNYGTTVFENGQTTTRIDFFNSQSVSLGLGIKFGEGMDLDISYNNLEIGKYYKVQQTYSSAYMEETFGCHFSVEYTMTW